MQPRISTISLGVSDLDRSIAFYRDGLGMPLKPGSEDEPFFETGNTSLTLCERSSLAEDAGVRDKGRGFHGVVLGQNVRSKVEVDSVLNQAKAAGGKITKPARDEDWGGYSGCFADPDGHLWQISWTPRAGKT